MRIHTMIYICVSVQLTLGQHLDPHDSTADEWTWCQLLGKQFRCCIAVKAQNRKFSVTSLSHGGALHKVQWACLLLLSFATCQKLYNGFSNAHSCQFTNNCQDEHDPYLRLAADMLSSTSNN